MGDTSKPELNQVGKLSLGMGLDNAKAALEAMGGTCTYSGFFTKVLSGADFDGESLYGSIGITNSDGQVSDIRVNYKNPGNKIKAIFEQHIKHFGPPLRISGNKGTADFPIDKDPTTVKTIDDAVNAGGFLLWDDGVACVNLTYAILTAEVGILIKTVTKSQGKQVISDDQF